MLIETIVLVGTAVLSVVNFARGLKTGEPGPQGIQGERGVQGVPGPQAAHQLGAEHALCGGCGRVVAHFSLTPKGLRCANCAPVE
jgi:hypothetical protein